MKKTIFFLTLASTIFNPTHVFANKENAKTTLKDIKQLQAEVQHVKTKQKILAEKTLNLKLDRLDSLKRELEQANGELENLQRESKDALNRGHNKLGKTLKEASLISLAVPLSYSLATIVQKFYFSTPADYDKSIIKFSAITASISLTTLYLADTYLTDSDYKKLNELIENKSNEIDQIMHNISIEVDRLENLLEAVKDQLGE